MELVKDTAEIFIEYLKNHSYPEDGIAVEYPLSKNCHVDIAILDQKQNIPIQLFELKANKTRRSIEFGTMQLQKCRSIFKEDIPAYLVFPKNEKPYFEVINIDKISNDTSEDNLNNEENIVLNYKAQRNKQIYKAAESIKQKKVKVIDNFKILFWIISSVVFGIGVLSKIGIITITLEDLVLIAFSIGLLLIPYASKIKILGIEFERLTKDKDKK